jgi:uncharacterized repeat protein (TIGR04052 family)
MHVFRVATATTLALIAGMTACSDNDTTSPLTGTDAGDAAANDATAKGDADETGTGGGDSGATITDAATDAAETASDAQGTSSVTLRFKAKVGTADFACGTHYPAQGATAVAVEPRDFRMYVSKVFLVDGAGNKVPLKLDTRSPWQTPDVALLDFENGTGACAAEGTPQTNATITGTVPAGAYHGIVFSNQIPDALNHGDPLTAPAPLQVGAMTWGWLYGFKFVKAELSALGVPAADAAPGLGLTHLGSTGCTNSTDGGDDFNKPPTTACTRLHQNEIQLTGFDPATSTIVADIGALFLDTDLSQDNQCHSEGTACPPLFAALGLSFATGAVLPSQTLYRVE